MEKNSKYKIFSLEEKKYLETMAKTDLSLAQIADNIKRSKNGIRNEYRKGGGRQLYNAEKRHAETLQSLKNRDYSGKNREDFYPQELTDKVKTLHEMGRSFWSVRKELSLNQTTLGKIYEKLGIKIKSNFQLLEEFETRIDAIEKSIEFIIDNMVSKDED